MMFSVYALAFYAGGQLISQGLLDFAALMKVFLAVTMASQAVGSSMAWGPDQAKAEAATRSIFALLDTASPIDPLGDEKPPIARPAGKVEFSAVTFSYPSRSGVKVLENFNLTVNEGESVGIVGASGSGKSTLIALLQRWYDPDSGSITLGGVGIKTLPVAQLRSYLALVQQEPALFADSIAYNIAYGSQDLHFPPNSGAPLAKNEKEEGGEGKEDLVSTDVKIKIPPLAFPAIPQSLVAAVTTANAISFVNSLENGFHTHCGSRGMQLSGGQRQRVAIARAVLRNAPVLLLDEATAALDSESEKTVQEALDRLVAGGGQTKIIVAHRLSTIKNCHKIVVLEKGVIVEQGTHEELWKNSEGVYRRLAAAQEGETA